MPTADQVSAESEATPRPWSLDIDVEDSEPDGTVIAGMITIRQILRCLHDSDWADSEDWNRDFANAELIVEAVNSFDTLKRRVEKLEKALQPFAIAAASWDAFRGEYLDSDSANNITVGDLRRARLALKGESQ